MNKIEYDQLWGELQSKQIYAQTYLEPAEYSEYLEADCEYIVDFDEEFTESEEQTIFSWFRFYVANVKKIGFLDVTYNDSQKHYQFKEIFDFTVKKGDKIFIHTLRD